MKNIKIEFCADHAQYFRPMLIAGFERPLIGTGCNEAEAYQEAADQVADVHPEINLPKRKGSKRRGFAYYFGKKTARAIAKSEENELWIYCLIYIPELPTPEPIPTRFFDYSQRVKLPKYNSSVSGLYSLHSVSDCRQYVRRAFGHVSPIEHVQRRDDAIRRAKTIFAAHRKIVDTEFKAIFGRVPTLADYKISGIWRDEFSDEVKNRLRAMNSDCSTWNRIAYLHNNCLFKKTGKLDRCF